VSTLLNRLRRMTPGELRWRGAVAARAGVERIRHRVREPRWRRSALSRALAREAVDARLATAMRRGDWLTAHEALFRRLCARPAAFGLDPAAASIIRDAVLSRWPRAADEAARLADRLLAGEYDLLGYRGLSFAAGDERIDWHFDPVHHRRSPRGFYAAVPFLDPAVGDHKLIWEINRHQHWLRLGRAAWLTGDHRYAARIVDDLESWMVQNPPLVGINWASMLEIGFRTISWVWSLHCLLGIEHSAMRPGSPWLVDLFIGLHQQLTHLERNLSYYFSPNTHLTGEALALYVAGTALPELAASARWAATGRRILLTEIERQVLPDGGHAERSTHYQRYTLDFYLLALLTARQARDREAESQFSDAARRLAEFTRVIASDRGELPLIGDDDGGMLWPVTGRPCSDVRDSLALAAVLLERPDLAPWGPAEEAVWVGGAGLATAAAWNDGACVPVTSRSFAETGYVVARDASGGHAVLDAGAHGYLNGGHAHADALSLTLSLEHRPFLVDPGTCTYTMDPVLRDRLRGTAAHNTLTMDDRPSSLPAGAFHWRRRTDARLDVSRHNDAFDWAEASHDGFGAVRHRRSLVRASGSGWLIVDDVVGGGRHTAAAHWHFDPRWEVTADGRRLRAVHADGREAWLLHDEGDIALYQGDAEPGLGWMAPVYGTLVPAWAARVTKACDAPFTMLTWIGDGTWRNPSLTRIAAECDPATPAAAVQVTDGNRTAVFMLRPGGTAPHAARTSRVGDFETDARMLHYRVADDRLLVADLAEGRYLSAAQRGWLTLEADRRIADLHVSLADGVIDLRASAPLPPLRLRVGIPFHVVRLNGHELPGGAGITVSIAPGNRGSDVRFSSPTRPWHPSGAAFADQ
jgi:uncharacterized heparinase superfamily protein